MKLHHFSSLLVSFQNCWKVRVYLGHSLTLVCTFFEIQIQYFHVGIKNPFPMTKSTFKDISFLDRLNWVTVHIQTEKMCGNYFYTSWLMGETCQSFPNSIREVGGKSPLPVREWEILMKGRTFSLGGENLCWSDFDHLNLFQS